MRIVDVVVHERGRNVAAVDRARAALRRSGLRRERNLRRRPIDLLQLIVQPQQAGVVIAVAAHVNGAATDVFEADERRLRRVR